MTVKVKWSPASAPFSGKKWKLSLIWSSVKYIRPSMCDQMLMVSLDRMQALAKQTKTNRFQITYCTSIWIWEIVIVWLRGGHYSKLIPYTENWTGKGVGTIVHAYWNQTLKAFEWIDQMMYMYALRWSRTNFLIAIIGGSPTGRGRGGHSHRRYVDSSDWDQNMVKWSSYISEVGQTVKQYLPIARSVVKVLA